MVDGSVTFVGTFNAATGTTYEAESGTIGGSATIPSDSSFSGGRAVGYLGTLVYSLLKKTLLHVKHIFRAWRDGYFAKRPR